MWTVRASILLGLALLASCDAKTDSCEAFYDSFDGQYAGVVLAFETAHASFGASKECGVYISGNDEFYSQVKRAWEKSKYPGDIRPILVDISGTLEPSHDPKLAPVLKVSGVKMVSAEVDAVSAREQYLLRTGRPPNW